MPLPVVLSAKHGQFSAHTTKTTFYTPASRADLVGFVRSRHTDNMLYMIVS
jgi:hypothetical protein